MCEQCQPPRPVLSRRSVMAGAAAILAVNALPFTRTRAEQKSSPDAPNAIPPAEALDRLMQGNDRYAANTPLEKDFSAARKEAAEAQSPIAAVVSCSDSHVVPTILFDQPPGSLFVTRLAGNVVNDDVFASLEYAVEFLGVPLILVLGHANCGTVATAIHMLRMRRELPGHLPGLIKAIEPAMLAAHARRPGDLLGAVVQENVRLGVKRLKNDAPVITEAIAANKLMVSGGVYDSTTAKVKLI
jgi:carbonic anhydrase